MLIEDHCGYGKDGVAIVERIIEVHDIFALDIAGLAEEIFEKYRGRLNERSATRLFKYLVDYYKRKFNEDKDYELAKALEIMLRVQLQKLIIVPTHNYHLCACRIAKKVFEEYEDTLDTLEKRWRKRIERLIYAYRACTRKKEPDVWEILKPLNELHEFEKTVEKFIEVATAIAESDLIKRDKNRLLRLLRLVFDDTFTEILCLSRTKVESAFDSVFFRLYPTRVAHYRDGKLPEWLFEVRL